MGSEDLNGEVEMVRASCGLGNLEGGIQDGADPHFQSQILKVMSGNVEGC